MKTATVYPLNPILKKHIDYFYFLSADSPAHKSLFYCFPKTSTPLSINRNAKQTFSQGSLISRGINPAKNTYSAAVLGMFTQPFLIKERGHVDEVTIVFRPLGINNFITKPFNKVASQNAQHFYEWNDDNYELFLREFFAASSHSKKARLLEEFLLTRYKAFTLQSKLEKVIELLQGETKLGEIALLAGWSEKTLYRNFTSHLGISPAGFRTILRFRSSLKEKIFSPEVKRLTNIALNNNFYDQSYFIKTYKKLTGQNPKSFFEAIEKLADKKFILRKLSK
jgi:AraC-like DNA-binding protein